MYNNERCQNSCIKYNLLLFIGQNEWRVEQKRVEDVWAVRRRLMSTDLRWTSSPLDQNILGYINSCNTHPINVATPLSNMLPVLILMVSPLLAATYARHIDTLPSCIPLTQILEVTPPPACCLTQWTWTYFLQVCHSSISTKSRCILFILGTRCSACYFCSVRFVFCCCIDWCQRGLQVNIQHNCNTSLTTNKID